MNSDQIRKVKRDKYSVEVSAGKIEFWDFNADDLDFILENLPEGLWGMLRSKMKGGESDFDLEGIIDSSLVTSLKSIIDYVLSTNAVEPIEEEDLEYINKSWPAKDKILLAVGIFKQVYSYFKDVEGNE